MATHEIYIPQRGSTQYSISNWISIPAPFPVDSPPTPDQQGFIIILSGLVSGFDVQPTPSEPDTGYDIDLGLDLSAPLQHTGRQPAPGFDLAFQVDQWVPFATMSAIGDADADWANWWIPSYVPLFETVGQENIPQVFGSISGDVPGILRVSTVVNDPSASLGGIGYHITLVGRLVQFTPYLIP